MDIRIGNGFDVHKLVEGDGIILCGVKIKSNFSLDGHSDADVGMHAITDSILGALALGDIGRWFPPSDLRWKNVDSKIFLLKAFELAKERGYSFSNIDLTIICEFPKISPVATEMIINIAKICELTVDRVSIKASTTEGLGFTGRSEGIAAMASACLIKIK